MKRIICLLLSITLSVFTFIYSVSATNLSPQDYIGYYVDVNYIDHHNEPGYMGTNTQHLQITNSGGGNNLELSFGWGGVHWKSGSTMEYFENDCLYAGFGFDESIYKYYYNTTSELLTVKKGDQKFIYRRVEPFADDYVDAGQTHIYTYPEGKYDIGNKPSQTILSSVKSGKSKNMKVKWKRNSKGKGYQIQYSTDKVFKKGNKTITVSGNKNTSKTIKGLKKKKYYIRIRTYRVKSSKKYYSGWSKIKSVAIK